MNDALYTKVQFQNDLAVLEAAKHLARTKVADGGAQGLWLLNVEYQLSTLEREYRRRWADSQRILGAYRGRKAQLESIQAHLQSNPSCEECIHAEPGLTRKVRYLKFMTGQILEGSMRQLEIDAAPEDAGVPLTWARERDSKRRAAFMPDCEYELCTGGAWRPVHRDELPSRVKWIE